MAGEVFVDSSAALAVVNRKGCGKLRHVRVGQVWVQQLAEEEDIKFKKILGEENPPSYVQHILLGLESTS